MASFMKKSFANSSAAAAEEKKNNDGSGASSGGSDAGDDDDDDDEANHRTIDSSHYSQNNNEMTSGDNNGGTDNMMVSEEEGHNIIMGGGGTEMMDETMNIISTDDPQDNSIVENDNDDTINDNGTTSCPKWSEVLSTPSSNPLFAPAADLHILKSNLHGLGLKQSVDRTKVLSRTGKHCSALLHEIAALHEELVRDMSKVCPALLEQATAGTPMEEFAKDVTARISSFADRTGDLGSRLRNDVAGPYRESSAKLADEGMKQYLRYGNARSKCAASRKEAIKSKKQYAIASKELDGAFAALRKARANRSNRKRKGTDSSNEDVDSSREEGIEVSRGGDTEATSPTWEEELRAYGTKKPNNNNNNSKKNNSVSKWCEAVIQSSLEVNASQANYALGVASENEAVEDCQGCERGALDCVQRLEEERIVFTIGLLDRFLQDTKESLENMSLDLSSTKPLDLTDGNHTELPLSTSATTSSNAPSSLFMSPRKRAQSDGGPAINETRMLGLPDNIAEIRDNMKSLMGRQLGRLKTLKLVAAFNEGLAAAMEGFGSNLKSQLETHPSNHAMNKNEGGNVLNAWNAILASFEMHSRHAEALSRRIKEANNELQIILVTAEREVKTLQEKEEFRWKSMCDAARVETKAKLKHKQCIADLEKARARLTVVEGEGGGSESGVSDGDNNNNNNNSNLSPMKQTTKMDRHMNKAMGRMFSILPGGGEDVMNKMLTPQQRQAINQRQLDEAKSKEEKGNESYEVARNVKSQWVVSYETEAEAAEFRCKSEERREWDEMQKSLVSTLDAIQNFREGHMKSVQSSIDTIEGQLKGKALEDVAEWTAYTQKRVEDQRARIVDDTSKQQQAEGDGGSGGQGEGTTGFCLKVQLIDCVEIKERIRTFLDEDDVADDEGDDEADEMDIDGGEYPAEPAPNETNGDIIENESKTPPPTPRAPLPDVPPDPLFDKMDPIFSKNIKNTTIDKYYAMGWYEEDLPLYGPWLEKKGSFDVTVTDWEKAPEEKDGEGGGFQNAWTGEKFPMKRTIKFKFRRTTHLYIGPPIAGVTQTQYLMKDGNDRCIVMMTVEMDGIPYSDVFAVEVRWSARRVNDVKDIAVDAGVFVRFLKSSMFAGKIKSGTLKETSPIHLDLFEVIKSAIASGEEDGGVDEDLEHVQVEEEPEQEKPEKVVISKAAVEVNKAEPVVLPEPPSQLDDMLQQVIAAFSSLPQSQRLLLAFVSFFFIAKMLFFRSKSDPIRADSLEDLAEKVDNLTNEIRDMKVMLESIIKLSDQSGRSNDKMEDKL